MIILDYWWQLLVGGLVVYFLCNINYADKRNLPSLTVYLCADLFLPNSLRKAFGFDGTPIKVIIRSKGEKDEK